MDKKRINQMLEILLLPYTDVEFDREKEYYRYFEAYEKVISEKNIDIGGLPERKKAETQYHDAKKKLLFYLKRNMVHTMKNFDDSFMLFNYYYPIDEITGMPSRSLEGKANRYYIRLLQKVAQSLLTFRDGSIAIRTWKNAAGDILGFDETFDKVEVWNTIVRMFTPDTLVAMFTVSCKYDETALCYQNSLISLADKLLVKVLRKGVAETHLHLNAGYDFQSIWERNMNLYLWVNEIKNIGALERDGEKSKVFSAAVTRACMIYYMNKLPDLRGIESFIYNAKFPDCIRQVILSIYNCADLKIDRECQDKIAIQLSSKYNQRETIMEVIDSCKDFLFIGLYAKYRELHVGSELIFLYQCFQYIESYNDDFFIQLFLRYIRIKNSIYNIGVQGNEEQGLDRFQIYFSNSKNNARVLKSKNDFLIEDGFRNYMKLSYLKKLEVRVAPSYPDFGNESLQYEYVKYVIKRGLLKQIYEILEKYRYLAWERMLSLEDLKTLKKLEKTGEKFFLTDEVKSNFHGDYEKYRFPVLGIVFHFIKYESMDNVSGHFCWQRIDDDEIRSTGHLFMQRERLGNLARAIGELRNEIPYLNRYVVGIDAASNENDSEPWVIYPAYHTIRNTKYTKPVLKMNDHGYQKIDNIGFTYHVGEDFRHPLSGFRHLDEVIEHFGYKAGDRLGHAIVLGMDIADWVRDNEIVVLKAGEMMENYLWIWGKIVYQNWQIPIQVEVLEGKILEIAQKIYSRQTGECRLTEIGNITVPMLYKAYTKKFDDDHSEIIHEYVGRTEEDSQSRCQTKSGDFCPRVRDTCAIWENSLWNYKKLLCTQYCPVFVARYNKSIPVSIKDVEADYLKCVQHNLIKVIEKRGIFVETNPTSNLAIGEIKKITKHPIFKLNSLVECEDSNHVMVTINADDPSVFATNVENEIAYIYHALKHDGYREEDILEWIDKVRDYGMESSFIKEEKSSKEMLDEITEILNSITARLKKI